MAALTITAANVATSSNLAALSRDQLAGETITEGMVVYLKTSNDRWMKAQCDGTAEEAGSGTRLGIALTPATNGRPIVVQEAGILTIGATVTVGLVYYLGTTAGDIFVVGDLSSTNYVTLVGVGATSSTLDLSVKRYTGYQKP